MKTSNAIIYSVSDTVYLKLNSISSHLGAMWEFELTDDLHLATQFPIHHRGFANERFGLKFKTSQNELEFNKLDLLPLLITITENIIIVKT
jgi:hypothetical protein